MSEANRADVPALEDGSGALEGQDPRVNPNEARSENRIINGVEFFLVSPDEENCQCARCGSSMVFVACDNCGGEGQVEDDDWQCEGDWLRCDWCRGTGGWYRCCSSKAYCEANPRPGRETQPVMGFDPHAFED